MLRLKLFTVNVVPMILLSSLILASCSSKFAESVRKVTYPPDFKYIEPGQLRSDMAKLGQNIYFLNQALAADQFDSPTLSATQQERVIVALRNIEKIARRLRASESGSNHPYMQNYMQDFVRQVSEARNAASMDPPRYYLAGKVSGGCTNCHKINR